MTGLAGVASLERPRGGFVGGEPSCAKKTSIAELRSLESPIGTVLSVIVSSTSGNRTGAGAGLDAGVGAEGGAEGGAWTAVAVAVAVAVSDAGVGAGAGAGTGHEGAGAETAGIGADIDGAGAGTWAGAGATVGAGAGVEMEGGDETGAGEGSTTPLLSADVFALGPVVTDDWSIVGGNGAGIRSGKDTAGPSAPCSIFIFWLPFFSDRFLCLRPK